MYETYWGLKEQPFDNSPNPRFFYLSPEHDEALVRLMYAVRQRKGCALLTGEYGCGKTTSSRALIQRVAAERLARAGGEGAAAQAPRPADRHPLSPQHARRRALRRLHRPPPADGRSIAADLHRGGREAHLRLHAGHAAGDQQHLRHRPAGRLLQEGHDDRRADHRRGDQGQGGRRLMVRMSDLVRGAKPGAPASAPPAPPPASRAPSPPAAEGKPPEPPAQVRSAARVTLRQAPAAPVEAPPTSAETPTDAIAL